MKLVNDFYDPVTFLVVESFYLSIVVGMIVEDNIDGPKNVHLDCALYEMMTLVSLLSLMMMIIVFLA